MDDLISRQAAIDAIGSYILSFTAIDRNYCEGLRDAKKLLYSVQSAEPKLDKKDMPEQGDSAKFGVITGETCAYWDSESNICALHRPSAQPSISDCWGCKCPKMERLKERLPSAQPEPHWIPIKTRPMTDEERDYWSDHFGYDIGYENDNMFDCKMPEDQQPVWVQSNCGYVYEDVCENDDGMLGLEGNGDWSDIVAWMPKYVPEPWRGENDDNCRRT